MLRGFPERLANQSLALRASFRKYSNIVAWYWFVPPFVMTSTWAPALRPVVASYIAVCTLNSWMVSGLGIGAPGEPPPGDCATSLTGRPSILKLLSTEVAPLLRNLPLPGLAPAPPPPLPLLP